MKLARTLLSVLTLSILAACGDTVTAPQAQPEVAPAMDGTTCAKETLADGTVRCAAPQIGSGG